MSDLSGSWKEALISGRRPIAVLAAGLLPWIVVPYGGGATLVFSFGLVNPEPGSVLPVTSYVLVQTSGLPPSLLAWPIAALLYGLGLGNWALAAIDREDRRITAGLFALAAFDLLYFAVTFSTRRLAAVALPVGTVSLAIAAWTSRP